MRWSNLLSFLFKELTLWLLLPATFITYYYFSQASPIEAVSSHLFIIIQLAAFVCVLSACVRFIVPHKKTAALMASFIYAACLLSLALYYVLVYVGLNTWGRVITEELLVSYAHQIKELFGALGLSYLGMQITLLAIFATCWFLLYRYHSNNTLTPFIARKLQSIMSGWIQTLLMLTLTIWAFYPLADFPYNTLKFIPYKEPISLTLWAGKPLTKAHSATQGNRLNIALNQQEQAVISSYLTNRKIKLTHTKPANVILIVVDALRPSNMGIYGYARNTTPYLSSISSLGKLRIMRNVSASCSESACGLMSIASSRFIHLLPDQPFTLQQVLKQHGYTTRMILGGDHTNFYNLKNLYGSVDSYFDASMSRESSYYANDDSIPLNETKRLPNWDNVPVMMQFHLMSAHPMGKRMLPYHTYLPMKNYNGLTQEKPNQAMINFYDNGVVQTDAMIKQLLQTLQAKHYLDNAVVVITADHGEALGEHQIYSHANGVYEEQLKIPFIFISFMPNQPIIEQKKKVVSQVDIAPTILFALGIDKPKNWNGTPIQIPAEPDFTYFHLHPNEGLYDYRNHKTKYKYWVNTQNGNEFAYNLSEDPLENNNIAPSLTKQLKQNWRVQLSAKP